MGYSVSGKKIRNYRRQSRQGTEGEKSTGLQRKNASVLSKCVDEAKMRLKPLAVRPVWGNLVLAIIEHLPNQDEALFVYMVSHS